MSDNDDANPYTPGSIAWWLWVHRHAVEVSDIAREVATLAQIILTNPGAFDALGQGDQVDRDVQEHFPPMLQAWLDGIQHMNAFQKAVDHGLSQTEPQPGG